MGVFVSNLMGRRRIHLCGYLSIKAVSCVGDSPFAFVCSLAGGGLSIYLGIFVSSLQVGLAVDLFGYL